MAADDKTPVNYDARRQARNQEPHAPKRSWKRIAAWVVTGGGLLLIVGLTAYVWYTVTYVKTVSARVRASVIVLSSVVDARVTEVCVKDGQQVDKDELLARLDDSELQARLEAAEAELRIRKIRHAEMAARALLTKGSIEAAIDQARSGLTVAKARVQSARATLALRSEQLSEEQRRADARHAESQAVLGKLVKGARQEDVKVAAARLATANALQALYRLEVEQSKKLVGEGIDSQHILEVRKTRLETQRNAVREAELEVERLEAGATPEELEAARQSLAVRAAESALSRAGSKQLDVLQADLAIREAEVAQAESQLKQAEARQAEIQIADEQTRAAEAELSQGQANIAGRQAALDQVAIRSPVAGIVTRIFCDVGEVCRKGVAFILVAEDDEPRWIEGFVREDDAMLVNVGDIAKVQAPVHGAPFVTGKVAQIGLHTQSLDGSESAEVRAGQAERVWLRIVPDAPLSGDPITGTSARAIIKVR